MAAGPRAGLGGGVGRREDPERVGPAERAHHRRGILDVAARDQVLEQGEPGIIEREVWRRLRADARRGEHAGEDDGGAEGAEGWWHRPVRYPEDDAVAIFCPCPASCVFMTDPGGDAVRVLPSTEVGWMAKQDNLDPQTRDLVRFAAAIAQGYEPELRERVGPLRSSQVPAQWVEELLLQSVLMVGYPRALIAFGVWRKFSGLPAPQSDRGPGLRPGRRMDAAGRGGLRHGVR